MKPSDWFHVGLHAAIVAGASAMTLHPLTAAVTSVLGVEGVDIWNKRAVGKDEIRDLCFRGLGAAVGLGLVALGWV